MSSRDLSKHPIASVRWALSHARIHRKEAEKLLVKRDYRGACHHFRTVALYLEGAAVLKEEKAKK